MGMVLEKGVDDKLDLWGEKLSITKSQGGKDFSTYNRAKED
jgi:hypothetical protein